MQGNKVARPCAHTATAKVMAILTDDRDGSEGVVAAQEAQQFNAIHIWHHHVLQHHHLKCQP